MRRESVVPGYGVVRLELDARGRERYLKVSWEGDPGRPMAWIPEPVLRRLAEMVLEPEA